MGRFRLPFRWRSSPAGSAPALARTTPGRPSPIDPAVMYAQNCAVPRRRRPRQPRDQEDAADGEGLLRPGLPRERADRRRGAHDHGRQGPDAGLRRQPEPAQDAVALGLRPAPRPRSGPLREVAPEGARRDTRPAMRLSAAVVLACLLVGRSVERERASPSPRAQGGRARPSGEGEQAGGRRASAPRPSRSSRRPTRSSRTRSSSSTALTATGALARTPRLRPTTAASSRASRRRPTAPRSRPASRRSRSRRPRARRREQRSRPRVRPPRRRSRARRAVPRRRRRRRRSRRHRLPPRARRRPWPWRRARRCRSCRRRPAGGEATTLVEAPHSNPEPTPTETSHGSRWWLWTTLAVVAAGGGFAAYWFLRPKDGDAAPDHPRELPVLTMRRPLTQLRLARAPRARPRGGRVQAVRLDPLRHGVRGRVDLVPDQLSVTVDRGRRRDAQHPRRPRRIRDRDHHLAGELHDRARSLAHGPRSPISIDALATATAVDRSGSARR